MNLAVTYIHGRPLILPAATLPRRDRAGKGGGSASPSSAHLPAKGAA